MVLQYNRKNIVLQQKFSTKMVSIRTNNGKKGQRILKINFRNGNKGEKERKSTKSIVLESQ
jgi:hypothetical protein